MNQVKKDVIKDLAGYIPILTFFSFLFGGLKLMATYLFFFNLDIFKFLEINEILSQAIKDLIPVVTISALTQLSLYLTEHKIAVKKTQRKWSMRMDVLTTRNLITYYLLMLIVIEIFYFFTKDLGNSLTIYFTITFGVVIAYIVAMYKEDRELRFKFSNIYGNYLVIYLPVALFSFAILSGLMNGNMMRNLHSTKNSYIKLKDKTIVSNESHYFIGFTKNYVFYYNAKNGTKDIYFIKDISEIKLVDD